MSLSTEISRLVKASREEMQEIEDLHKVIRLNFKSLEICLQESPEYLSQIQILKRTIDEIDMLGEDNQELEGERLILEQIQTEDLQVRHHRIQDYQAIIEEKRSLLTTKEDNVRRLTVPRIQALTLQAETNTQAFESEVQQCVTLQENLKAERLRLQQLQKQVKQFRQHISELTERTKQNVMSSSDHYHRFINGTSKPLVMLQRPKYMKLCKVEYMEMNLAEGISNKPQLWFQERLNILRRENIALVNRLKEETELTAFMSKDMEVLRFNYQTIRTGGRISAMKPEPPKPVEIQSPSKREQVLSFRKLPNLQSKSKGGEPADWDECRSV